jgi:tRNA-splicing endonuclease subunit Sen34
MDPSAETAPSLPFPIFRISSKIERYLLYDIKVITWLRKTHHILGVLIGTLPQIPQQNVFLGLPLELMPEEARFLIERGLAYTVNDRQWHESGMETLTLAQREAFVRDLASQGREAAKAAERKRMEGTERAMRKLRLASTPVRTGISGTGRGDATSDVGGSASISISPALEAHPGPATDSASPTSNAEAWAITLTTAYPPLPYPRDQANAPLPAVKASTYAVFKHLVDRGYYLSPGLRFGCEFLVYPGDPLRFHSHFLAVTADWDDEVDLLDIIGGGRLGTGVKKGYLIGGIEQKQDEKAAALQDANQCRIFCIEWGGM